MKKIISSIMVIVGLTSSFIFTMDSDELNDLERSLAASRQALNERLSSKEIPKEEKDQAVEEAAVNLLCALKDTISQPGHERDIEATTNVAAGVDLLSQMLPNDEVSELLKAGLEEFINSDD